jgi:outer membrane protein OmpA-like peptidoglycan-associated protein
MRSKSLFAAVLAAAAFALSFSTASVAGDIPDPVSEKITLSTNANFALGSTALEVSAQKELDGVLEILRGVNLEALVVTAYASPDDPAYDAGFALKRAKSVRAYLVLNGVDPDRVYVEGRPLDRLERVSMISLEAVYAPY